MTKTLADYLSEGGVKGKTFQDKFLDTYKVIRINELKRGRDIILEVSRYNFPGWSGSMNYELVDHLRDEEVSVPSGVGSA